MNPLLIEELERLNQSFLSFRPYELETLEGSRILVSEPFQKLYGEDQKKHGDIRLKNGTIALLRYDQLKDVIRFVPPWKRPFHWLYRHPEQVALTVLCLFFGVVFGIGMETCATAALYRSEHPVSQK